MTSGVSLFVRQLAQNPRNIGAVFPSSQALGRAMARELPRSPGKIVELGVGTGKITQGILDAGHAASDLCLIEMNAAFCNVLCKQFPDCAVYNAMAQDMDQLDLGNISAVVSSLPMLNMPTSLQHDITRAIFDILQPSGKLIQFTYGLNPPLDPKVIADSNLSWKKCTRIWGNIPPATVYTFEQLN